VQNHCHFLTEKLSIFCVRYSQNYKLTPAPVRSNKIVGV
jgi:hypothetical protein